MLVELVKHKNIALGLVENNKREILITQRLDLKIPEAHMKWDLVGGSVEKDETVEETVLRECLEETGYKIMAVEALPLSVQKNWQHSDYVLRASLICLRCKLIAGEPHLYDPKINDVKWVGADEIVNYDLLPTTREFIKYYLNKKHIWE